MKDMKDKKANSLIKKIKYLDRKCKKDFCRFSGLFDANKRGIWFKMGRKKSLFYNKWQSICVIKSNKSNSYEKEKNDRRFEEDVGISPGD